MADTPDIVYFDLETQRSSGDVGGWSNKDRMGMSVGVTFSTRLGEYRIYREPQADQLVDQLIRADLVVGFNHIWFDYKVLQAYTILDLESQTRNLDLMLDLENQLGYKPSLDAISQSSLGLGKTAEGLQAIVWFRQGKWREIAEYCAYDVKVTMRVHEFGRRHGHVKFIDKNAREHEIPVTW